MQPFVKHIDVYVRTAVWFISIAGNNGAGEIYTEEEREQFRDDTKALVKHAKYLEDQMNGLWSLFFTSSEGQKLAQQMFGDRMAEFIKDKRLLKGFTPKFAIGCRRITPGKKICFVEMRAEKSADRCKATPTCEPYRNPMLTSTSPP